MPDTATQVIANLYNKGNPAFSNVALTSGTAVQDATGKDSQWYIPITGGSAGTVKVDIGPTSGVANTIIAATAANAVASQTLSVRLPAGWYIKVTVAVATIGANAQVVAS